MLRTYIWQWARHLDWLDLQFDYRLCIGSYQHRRVVRSLWAKTRCHLQRWLWFYRSFRSPIVPNAHDLHSMDCPQHCTIVLHRHPDLQSHFRKLLWLLFHLCNRNKKTMLESWTEVWVQPSNTYIQQIQLCLLCPILVNWQLCTYKYRHRCVLIWLYLKQYHP